MKVNRVFFFLLFFLAISGFSSVAQNTESKPLENVLRLLEEQFDVVFTYADKNIKNVTVKLPKQELSLDKYLSVIESQSNLIFKKINSRYIAIQYQQKKITITGTLIDKSTGNPISGAIVYVGNSKTISNSKGRFIHKTKSKKELELIVRHDEYQTVQQNLKASTDIDIKIEIDPIIKSPENTGGQSVDSRSEIPFSFHHHLNSTIVAGLAEPDILFGVQMLPGIQSANETVSNINIRGGANDQSLILIDGVKMYQTGHFFGQMSAFNSHLVKKTKVINSGTNAFYGEGVSGIIEMELQDSLVNQFEAEAGINMLSADAIVKIPLTKKITLVAGGRHSINTVLQTHTYDNYFEKVFSNTEVMKDIHTQDIKFDENPDFTFYDVSCKLLYDISEKDKLRISAHKTGDNLKFDEYAVVLDTIYTQESHLEQSGLLSNLKYTHSWNEKHQTGFSAFYSDYNLESNNVSITENENHIQLNRVTDWGLKLNLRDKINDQIILNSGYQFEEVSILNKDNLQTPNYRRQDENELMIHSLFSEGEFINLFDKMNIQAGLRANYYSEINKLSVEPRFVIDFSLNKKLNLKASFEKKSQHTSQVIDFETDFLGVDNRRWVLSDEKDVPIITSHQLTIGAKYGFTDFMFAVEGYLKNVAGITSYSQGFQNQYQYEYSIGEYNALGLEMNANKRFEKINLWLNYALSNNQYYFRDFSISTFPNNYDIRHSLVLGGVYNIKSFEVSVGANYKTGRPYTRVLNKNSKGQEIVYQKPNSSRLNDFIRVDISAKYKLRIKKVNAAFAVSIWNLLDRKNEINIYYQQNENREIEEIKQYSLGFTPNVSLRFWF